MYNELKVSIWTGKANGLSNVDYREHIIMHIGKTMPFDLRRNYMTFFSECYWNSELVLTIIMTYHNLAHQLIHYSGHIGQVIHGTT